MKIFLFLLIALFPFISGNRTPGAVVSLESDREKNLVAFQQTGEKGKVSFAYLDAGNYQLFIEFPWQKESRNERKRRFSTLSKAAFDIRSKTYYYQGKEGYFSIRFSGLKKIEPESFLPVFREVNRDEFTQINILRFQTAKNGGQIKAVVKTLTPGQYKRKTEKAGNDISMLSIPGIK